MKILLVGTSFEARYGGPAVSVAALGVALAKIGASVSAWAPDGSAPSSEALLQGGVSAYGGSLQNLITTSGAPDLIHDNGIWLSHNHSVRRVAAHLGCGRVVSPRGMLEPWARAHKRWKKSLAWHLYQRRDLIAADGIHATSEAERQNLARLGITGNVCLIANGLSSSAFEGVTVRSGGGRRTALFLGRLHPVKGLPMLLSAWSTVRPDGWRLVLAGPDEGQHGVDLRRQAEHLGLGNVVEFRGPIEGRSKAEALACADLFILPSLSESFGMAVAEALAAKVPVLTTTAVPWPELETERAGWRVTSTVEGLQHGLRHATSLASDRLQEMGEAGGKFVRRRLDWEALVSDFVIMYEQALAKQRRSS